MYLDQPDTWPTPDGIIYRSLNRKRTIAHALYNSPVGTKGAWKAVCGITIPDGGAGPRARRTTICFDCYKRVITNRYLVPTTP